jgi:Tfp pilus assembly protein PilX
MIPRRPSPVSDEQGVALVLVVVLTAVLGLLAVTLIDLVTNEGDRSAQSARQSAAFQAAEAGVDDYIAKLVDDRMYYVHHVHPGESTRRASNGATVAAGATWTFDLNWTYPNGRDAWRRLDNGYEYNLQIRPPSAGSQGVRILSTGRREGSTTESRSIEALIRPSSVADYRMIANRDITYGSTATTYGKIYAGIDENGVPHNVTHLGTAHDNIYAEGLVLGSPNLQDGARTYDRFTIRSVMKNPINFSSLLTSLVDIQRASQAGGVFLDDPAIDGWRLTFQTDGTFLVQKCLRNSGRDLAESTPICEAATTRTVPSNGAIYASRAVIVSGVVNGRVTVASNDNVVIADDISYASSGDDVLGLVARNEMIVAEWTPYNLSWRAGTIVSGGQWRSWSYSGSHGTMVFSGSTATNLGGFMNMFQTRIYDYDSTLLYLPPPWFPTVEDAYTVIRFRELAQ